MTFIKIDRATIKENPRAGRTTSMMQGPRTATFEFPNGGKIPANLLSKVEIMEWRDAERPEDGTHLRGYIIDPDDYGLFARIPGISVKYDHGSQSFDHMPEPEYLYKYQNPPVTCSNCQATIGVSEITTDVYQDENDDDIYVDQVCPICGAYDSFGEIEYESIEEALKEVKL